MKKTLLSILCLVLTIGMLSGCGNSSNEDSKSNSNNEQKLSCTKTETDEDGYETKSDMVVTYKDNKVITVEETSLAKMDKDVLEMSYSFSAIFAEALNKVDGMEVTYSKEGEDTLKSVVKVDYSKINVDQLKEAFGSSFDETDAFYKNTDITIDEFKEQNLKDYTCK